MSATEKIEQLADRLEYFNLWRGPDNVEDLPMPNPRDVTIDLAAAIGIIRFVALGQHYQALENFTLGQKIEKLQNELDARKAAE